ncbi:P1 family peptidase [candidate division KSB1 bacterium]|nr:P1 family peptidase [candidate division KSB1 bacterium]
MSNFNAITDVSGLLVGHFTCAEHASGVTVVLCPKGAVAGVDVRGSAPGTRETDLLEPHNLVERIQAVVLCGSSVYGLAAVDGVVRWLARKGYGFPLSGGKVVPIVPAAALFDLGRGKTFIPPVDAEWGFKACEAAKGGAVGMGCVGAGTGAIAGTIKGGVGTASRKLASGITVAAIIAVNSLGSVINPATGRSWEMNEEIDNEFSTLREKSIILPDPYNSFMPTNTTIGVVATDAQLNKAQARKIAQMAQDGLARAIRPAHTMFDGDTIFALSTGKKALPQMEGFFASPQAQGITEIGHAAAQCISRAIIHAVFAAESMGSIKAFKDL